VYDGTACDVLCSAVRCGMRRLWCEVQCGVVCVLEHTIQIHRDDWCWLAPGRVLDLVRAAKSVGCACVRE